MDGLVDFFRNIFSFLWRNKGLIALIPLLMLAWIPVIFPYSDLRAVVATTVSKAMGDGFAIDFDQISLVPGFPFALKLEDFEFNGPGLPSLSADRLVASPSIGMIVSRSPSGSIEAEGMFKGNINASLSSGAKSKSGSSRQDIKTDISGVQLGLLTDALRRAGMIGFNVQGTLDSTGTASIDPNFEDQPQADLAVQGKTVLIPSIPITIFNSTILTPSLEFGRLDFKGKMDNGRLQIEDLVLGQSTDALIGRVRGEIGVAFVREPAVGAEGGPSRVRAVPGSYDFKVELTFTKPLHDAVSNSGTGLALAYLLKYQTIEGQKYKYAFGIKADAIGMQGQLYALSGAK